MTKSGMLSKGRPRSPEHVLMRQARVAEWSHLIEVGPAEEDLVVQRVRATAAAGTCTEQKQGLSEQHRVGAGRALAWAAAAAAGSRCT